MTGHKRLSDTTLYHMTKREMLEYIRTLEHNLEDADERLERQYDIMKRAWIRKR